MMCKYSMRASGGTLPLLWLGVLLLGTFALCFIQPLAAQEYRGTVRGTITDPSHAVVPGAKVTLKNVNTNVERTVQADTGGSYLFDFVIPGNYTVTVEAAGFEKYVQEDVTVQVTSDLTVNAVLTLGSTTQTIEVTAAVAQVQFNTSNPTTIISGNNLKELPVLYSNPFTLAMLDPAVVNEYWAQRVPYYMYASSDMNIGGQTAGKNEMLLDGTPLNEAERGSYTPPMDAVQELVVRLNSTDSENGFSGGGAIDMSIKSGTNTVHGSAYYFGHNPALDALANRIDRSPSNYRQNSWGFSLGNPIIKDKLFNFFAFEWWHNETPWSQEETMPTAAEKTGDFTGALTAEGLQRTVYDPTTTVFNPATNAVTRTPVSCQGIVNKMCQGQIDPTAALLMPYIWGPNNAGDSPDGLNNLKVTYPWWAHYWNLTDRADYNINDRWRFFARFSKYQTRLDNTNWSNNDSIGVPSDNGGIMDALNSGADMLWMVNPKTTVDFRYGVTYWEDEYNSPIFKLKNNVTCTGAPSQNCNVWQYLWPNNQWYQPIINPLISEESLYFPNFNMSGIGSSTMGWDSMWGARGRSHNPTVDVTHEIGKHHMKFGGQLRYSYDDNIIYPTGAGQLNFNAVDTGSTFLSNFNPAESGDMWASLFMGAMDSGNSSVSPRLDIHQQQWSFYVQDDYKVNSRITLNLGLRWERETAPADTERRLVQTMDMTEAIPQLQGFTVWGPQQLAALPPNAASLQNMVYSFNGAMLRTSNADPRMYDAPWKTLLPRVGAAIKLNEKTALRFGWARYAVPWVTVHPECDYLPINGYSSNSPMLGPLEGVPRTFLSNPFPTSGANTNPEQVPMGDALGAYQDLGNSIPYFWNGADMKTPINDRFNFTVQHQAPDRILLAGTMSMMFEHNAQDATPNYNINMMNPMLAYQYQGLVAESVPNPFYGNAKLTPTNFPGVLGTEQTVPLSQLLVKYPQYGSISQFGIPGYRDHYYGLSFSATRPMFHGYTILAMYNYNHDFSSKYFNDVDTYNQQLSWMDNAAPRHVIRLVGTYELPFGKGRQFLTNAPKAVDAILGGWSTSHILWWKSGDLDQFGADQLTCNPTQNIPSGSYFNGSCLGYLPAYTVRTNPWYYENLHGPHIWDLDSTLAKTFKLTEKLSLELRAEFYNMTNSFMPSDPDTTPLDGTTGRSTWVASQTYGRQMQYNLHLRW